MAIVLSESVLLLLVNLLLLLWINFLIISIIIPCIWWKYLEFSFGTSFGWCKFELLMQMPISFLKVNSCSYLVVLESFCIVTYFIINFLAHRCLLVFTLYYLAAFFWLVSFFEVGNFINLTNSVSFFFFFGLIILWISWIPLQDIGRWCKSTISDMLIAIFPYFIFTQLFISEIHSLLAFVITLRIYVFFFPVGLFYHY